MLDNGWKIEAVQKTNQTYVSEQLLWQLCGKYIWEWEDGRNVTFLACDVWGKIQKGSRLEGRIAKQQPILQVEIVPDQTLKVHDYIESLWETQTRWKAIAAVYKIGDKWLQGKMTSRYILEIEQIEEAERFDVESEEQRTIKNDS